MRKAGWWVIEWDVKLGPEYDLLVPGNLRRLLSWIAIADWIHLGTPCSSFSTARRGKPGSPGGPLRTVAHPMGLPGLPEKDALKVK
eukprot:3310733-Heterocapsa_arctica.AAC.1